MCVVHLEDKLLGKLLDIIVGLQIFLDRRLKGSGDEEVLLFQAQLFTLIIVVIGIKNVADGLGQVFLLDGLLVVALVKGIELEALDRLSVPDSQGIDKAVAVADDRHIIGDSLDSAVSLKAVHVPAQFLVKVADGMSAEMYFLSILGAAQLKGISVLEPVVRNFLLEAVFNFLLEHSVMVADTAAVSGVVQSGEGIQEAGSKTSEAAVSECRVRFLILDRIQFEAKLFECLSDGLISHEVDRVIAERAAHQKLHGQVDKPLGILVIKSLLRAHPAVDDLIFESQSGCLEHLLLRGFLHCAAVHGAHIVLYTSLKKVFVKFNSRSFYHKFLTSEHSGKADKSVSLHGARNAPCGCHAAIFHSLTRPEQAAEKMYVSRFTFCGVGRDQGDPRAPL